MSEDNIRGTGQRKKARRGRRLKGASPSKETPIRKASSEIPTMQLPKILQILPPPLPKAPTKQQEASLMKSRRPIRLGDLHSQRQKTSISLTFKSNGTSCEAPIIEGNGVKPLSSSTFTTNLEITPKLTEGGGDETQDNNGDHTPVLLAHKKNKYPPTKAASKYTTLQSSLTQKNALSSPPTPRLLDHLMACTPSVAKLVVTVKIDGKVLGQPEICSESDDDSSIDSENNEAMTKVQAMYADKLNTVIINLDVASPTEIEDTYHLFEEADRVSVSKSRRMPLNKMHGKQNACVSTVMYLSALACFTKEGLNVPPISKDDYFKMISSKAIKKTGDGLHQWLHQVGADVELGDQLIQIFRTACGGSFQKKVEVPQCVFCIPSLDAMFYEFTKIRIHTQALMICHACDAYVMLKFPADDAIYCIDTISTTGMPAYYQKLDGKEEAKTHLLFKAMTKVQTDNDVLGGHKRHSRNNSHTLQHFVYFIIQSPIERIDQYHLDSVIDHFVRLNAKKRRSSNDKDTSVNDGKYNNLSIQLNATTCC